VVTESERRSQVESNYGRTLGWDVWADEEHIATLSETTQTDMFWYRYKVDAVSPEAYDAKRWWDGTLTFRNSGTARRA
jgi:hypothetical protein